jgi:hypothetical protein
MSLEHLSLSATREKTPRSASKRLPETDDTHEEIEELLSPHDDLDALVREIKSKHSLPSGVDVQCAQNSRGNRWLRVTIADDAEEGAKTQVMTLLEPLHVLYGIEESTFD